jgi:hypothetical protein
MRACRSYPLAGAESKNSRKVPDRWQARRETNVAKTFTILLRPLLEKQLANALSWYQTGCSVSYRLTLYAIVRAFLLKAEP